MNLLYFASCNLEYHIKKFYYRKLNQVHINTYNRLNNNMKLTNDNKNGSFCLYKGGIRNIKSIRTT